MAGGTAGDGEPSLTGCQWATSPLLELPGVSGSQLGLSLPMKEMKGTQFSGGWGLWLRCERQEAHVCRAKLKEQLRVAEDYSM